MLAHALTRSRNILTLCASRRNAGYDSVACSSRSERTGALEAELSLLRTEREAVVAQLGAIAYPVLTFPNEITSEIFIRYVKDYGNRMRSTRVCRLCEIWTRLSSHVQFPLWMLCSGELPLHFRATVPPATGHGDFRPLPKPPIPLILLRLRTITVDGSLAAELLDHLILPALENLFICPGAESDPVPDIVGQLVSRSSCALRKFRLVLDGAEKGALEQFEDMAAGINLLWNRSK
ncbi:hypothetical protein FB45DRAFT_898137 [Roridomyces roridus]|uniref:F-box domain-containing protein n=1 Tax=Roridomyces roridus TaxID=1738132 RepID=A0AAD7FV49_9AGAR|nr:hypothetical protein FB45DRAFT_898137 [Roridomyces roridus]